METSHGKYGWILWIKSINENFVWKFWMKTVNEN